VAYNWIVGVGVLLAALAMTFTFAGGSAPAGSSGLRGTVMRGPTKPVCRVNESCEVPARGLVLRFSRGGSVKAEVTTSRSGTYSVKLPAGRYGVTTPRRGPGTGLTPRVVRVPRARMARVDFHLDTGIQ
jgi:hypothetical protein